MKIEWKSVESSNVKRVGYIRGKKLLYIEYHSGGTYQYHPISNRTYQELMSAPSIGKYIWANIRNNSAYQWEKIK